MNEPVAIPRRRRATAHAGVAFALALPLTYGTALWLVARHHADGARELGEPSLVAHWLRDATLALPAVFAAVWLALALTRRVLEPHAAEVGRGIVALGDAVAAGVATSIAFGAGTAVHARLFPPVDHGAYVGPLHAEHLEQQPLLEHMLADGLSALTVALPLAGAAVAALALVAVGGRVPRVAVVAAAAAALAGVAAWGANAHQQPIPDTNPEATELRDRISPCFDDSPVAPPFSARLPIPPVAQTVPSAEANGDAYEIHELRGETEIIPGVRTPIWGYADASTLPLPGLTSPLLVPTVPGPTILARRLIPVHARFVNNLPPDEDPAGIIVKTQIDREKHPFRPSSTVVHLHGVNTDHISDGFPDFSDGHEHRKDPGSSFVHHYPNNEHNRAATYWYHDHSVHITSNHLYRGLAAFYILTDPQEERLNLPKGYGVADIPLMIKDFMIDPATGKLVYDNCSHMGAYGDVMSVNGKQQPFFDVGTRKYRLRLLNASDARQYRLALRPAGRLHDPAANHPFQVIASDQGLLAAPRTTTWVHITPSERVDIVVDFKTYPVGTRLVMVNELIDSYDDKKLFPIMAFDVTRADLDESTVPPVLSEDHFVEPPAQNRQFDFDRQGGYWSINSLQFDPQRADATPLVETNEEWTLVNKSGGWGHPVHLHLGKFKIVSINGRPPRPDEDGWKDTVWLGPNQNVKVVHEFKRFGGRFVFHCHNGSHEDHDMMTQFRVIGGIESP